MSNDRQRPLFIPDFIVIPYQLLTDRELETMDKHLYGMIYWFENMKDGECRASNQTLASLLYTTTRVVQNSLNTLEKRGYIEREYKDAAKRNRTRIHGTVSYKKHVSPTGDRQKTNAPQVTRERPIGDRHESPIGDQIKNIEIKNSDKTTPPPSASDDPVTSTSPIEKQIAEVLFRFKCVNPSYRLAFNRKPQREAAGRLLEQFGFDTVCGMVGYLPTSNADRFAPTITTAIELERDLGRLKAWADKRRSTSGRGKKIISASTPA